MADTDLRVEQKAVTPDGDWQVLLVRNPRATGEPMAPVPVVTGGGVSPAAPEARMATAPRITIGISLGLFAALALAHLLWVWSFTARLIPSTATAPTPHIRVHWFWLEFSPTVDWALVLLVVFAAAAGSAAQLSLVFANRAGLRTLESTWTWWYLLRPGAATIVGVVAYVVLKAGFLGSVTDQDQHSIAFAAAVGTLAGMFTDTLISKLRGALGASPFERATVTEATDGSADGSSSQQAPNGAVAVNAPVVVPSADASAAPNPLPPPPVTPVAVPQQAQPEASTARRELIGDVRLMQTDNRPRPEDGDQDVDQHPLPYPGSPAGADGLDEDGAQS
ncbi:MAG: hypothetical protein ACJ735_03950 [Actinomycetes bacterium]